MPTMNVAHFSSARKQYSPEGFQLHDLMLYNRGDNAVAVPPLYEEIDIGDDSPARCLKDALWLLHSKEAPDVPIAVLMSPSTSYGQVNGIKFEVAVPPVENSLAIVENLFRTLETTVHESKSYRGKVLSLEVKDHYRGQSSGIIVHRLRSVAIDDLILPRKTVDLLERNTVAFVGQREHLRKFGMQTKKGLLFYGPPGTGKTHTIHYLAGALPGHTTLLITAEQVGLIAEFMTLARLLQPSIVVIEDADLIGRNRQQMQSPCEEIALNRLLNEMDGLREDADILFILTTNRPEMLEPALAARPGRIDQAIEFPLPDEEGRLKLIKLYSRNAALNEQTLRSTVRKTEGVSASFIKELMRRSAQFAIERTGKLAIALADMDSALEEMLFAGGSLNRQLLGAACSDAAGQQE